MNFILRLLVGLIVGMCGMGLSGQTYAAGAGFRAGAAAVDITPTKFPVRVNGNMTERLAQKAMDPLHARSLALDDGTTKIVFCIVDTCMLPRDLIDRAKAMAARETGLPAERMMISATHAHTAASSMGCLGSRADPDYVAWLPPRLAASIRAAVENLQPARIGWGAVDDWAHTHNRRWIRRADRSIEDPFGNVTVRANMHPGYESPDVIGPSGPVDPGLSVLAVQTRDGRPLAVLANYSQHYFGATPISADYYGAFARHMAELLGQVSSEGPFVAMMSQGTSGDLMWMDYGAPKKSPTLEVYAAEVAQEALRAYRAIVWRDHVPLGMVQRSLPLAYRVPDAARLAWARARVEALKDEVPKARPDIYAHEAVYLHERQKTELLLQAIRIGDLSIATLPNEVFAITGLKLKAQAPLGAHFNIELANGAEGYIPPLEQFGFGGYTTWPARTAGLEVQAEPKIMVALLAALEEVSGRKIRAIRDEHGPYAQAILMGRPVSYWRLNEIAGTVAHNAVAKAPEAAIVRGALYLPGAGTSSGSGAQEALTPSAFSGPSQLNRAVHFVDGHLEAGGLNLGPTHSIAFWFWLGETSGASERSGSLVAWPTGEALRYRQSADHRMQLYVQGEREAAPESGPAAARADDWHFAVVVRDGDRLRVHLDGSATRAIEQAVVPSGKVASLRFGEGLEGKLDEIAVFDRALSPAEIDAFWAVSGVRSR